MCLHLGSVCANMKSRGNRWKRLTCLDYEIIASDCKPGDYFFFVNGNPHFTEGNCDSHHITTFLPSKIPFAFRKVNRFRLSSWHFYFTIIRSQEQTFFLCSLILFATPLPAVLSRCFRSWQTALEECYIFLGFRFSSHLAPTAFHLPHGMHSRPLLPQGPVGNPASKRSKSRYACFGFLRTCAPHLLICCRPRSNVSAGHGRQPHILQSKRLIWGC